MPQLCERDAAWLDCHPTRLLASAARDETALKFQLLRRELHKVQSELARLKMLHARDQCEREERVIIIASLLGVEMAFCIEKRTN